MQTKWLTLKVALGVLSACSPTVPDDIGALVDGFGTATANAQSRMTTQDQVDAILGGSIEATALEPGMPSSQPIEGFEPASTPNTNRALAQANTGGISNTNDFNAISETFSIEDDAQRIAEQGQQYQLISPTAMPERRAGQVSIIEFALVHLLERGVKHYRRSPFATVRRSELNCATYPSADKAQQAFLDTGGPEKDRLNLDPDGDGYACGWDPTPYRVAAGR